MVVAWAAAWAEPAVVQVPGGTYEIGDPSRPVELSAFRLMAHEVTQAEYLEVTGLAPSWFSGCPSCPVEGVSWYDAVAYANALSRRQGLKPAYRIREERVRWRRSADGWRLPTEAEWEVAARAGASGRYAGGDDLDAVGWYRDNAEGRTHPVCEKRPNALGLCDMAGNVAEWTWDWHAPYPAALGSNPAGPESGANRVNRGGSYWAEASLLDGLGSAASTPNDSPAPLGRVVAPAAPPKASVAELTYRAYAVPWFTRWGDTSTVGIRLARGP